jgi:pilus assembly protein FimV
MRFCTATASWVLLALLPFTASALGLGNISLDSALNEPFSAEIPLQSVGSTDLTLLTVTLASRETFERYGLDKPAFLNSFEFELVKNADGQPLISVSSRTPVAEPFVTFLVDVKWASGRLLREYTVLLDPPLFEEAVVQPQSTVTPAITATPVETETAGQVERQPVSESEPALVAAPAVTEAVADEPAAEPDPEPAAVEQQSELRAVVEPEPEVVAEETVTESVQEVPEPVAADQQQSQAVPEPPAAFEPQAEALTDEYTAQRGDTLWGIANRTRADSGLTNNQMMLALFRANPEAFLGNINALKAGSILRIPEQQEAADVGVREANQAAVQQHTDWASGSITRTESAGNQLQLVAPTEDYSAADEQAFAEDAEVSSGDDALETRVEDDERLLQVDDAELAAMQDRIGDAEQTEAAEAELETDDGSLGLMDESLESEALDEDILVEGMDGDIASPFADDAPLAEEVAEAEITPLEEEAPVDASKVVELPDQDESSLIGTLLGSYWVWGAAGLLLLLGLFLVRRRSGAAEDEAIGTWDEEDIRNVAHEQTLKDFSELPSFDESIVVDEVDDALTEDAAAPAEIPEPEAEPEAEPIFDAESESSIRDAAEKEAEADQPVDFSEDFPEDITEQASVDLPQIADIAADAAPARDDEVELPLEKTITTGALLNLDQTDPVAEAEFHMAYGLYDQAADLLVRALDDEPDNRVYRVKLIEVYFVWENKDGFLLQATAFHESIGDSSDPDWNKVLILGKQLCPDAELFAGADAAAPSADAMDLELSDVGETEIDFSLGGTEVKALDGDVLDMDLGGDLLDDVTDHDLALDLGAEADAGADDDGFTLNFDDEPATEESTAEDDDFAATLRLNDDLAVTIESPTIEADMGAATMESPTLNVDLGELNESDSGSPLELTRVEPRVEVPGDTSDTAEMRALNEDSLTDPAALDIDLSGLADLEEGDAGADNAPTVSIDIDSTLNQLDNTGEFLTPEDMSKTILPDHEPEVPPIPVNIDSTLNQLDNTGELLTPVDMGKTIADDQVTLTANFDVDELAEGGGDTLQQPSLDSAADGDTAEQPEISVDDELTTDYDSDGSVAPEDATMTEVGTKLDLARAYIDMGDPDGARSILNEVLDEGGDSQQQEARQLLEELGD